MVKLRCQRCGYKWDYKGQSEWYASCPRCRSSVKVKPKLKPKVISDSVVRGDGDEGPLEKIKRMAEESRR